MYKWYLCLVSMLKYLDVQNILGSLLIFNIFFQII